MGAAPAASVPVVHGRRRADRVSLTRVDLFAPWHVTVLVLGTLAVLSVGLLDLHRFAPLWPVTGLAVATALVTQARWGLLLAVVGALAFLPSVGPVDAVAGFTAAVPAVLVSVLVLRRNGRWVRVDDVASLLRVLVVVAVAVPVLSAATGVVTEAAFDGTVTAGAWPAWAVADAVSCLLIPVPMLIWWSRDDRGLGVGPTAIDRVLVVVAALVVAAGSGIGVVAGVMPSGFFLLLAVIWIAQRWGARGVVLAVYLATAIAAHLTLTGRGVFAGAGTEQLARLSLTIAMVLLAGILTAVVARQRDQAMADLAEANAELAQEAADGARTLATLISNLSGVAYRCRDDADYTVLSASPGIREVLGVDPADEEARRWGLAKGIHPDDLAGVRRDVDAAVAQGRPFVLEYRIVRPDGAVRWVWEQGRVVGTGADGCRLLEGVIYDITDRVSSQQLLIDEARVLDVAMTDGDAATLQAQLAAALARHSGGAEVVVLGLDGSGVVGSVDGDPHRAAPAWAPASGQPVAGHPVWQEAMAGRPATAPTGGEHGRTFVAPVADSNGRVEALLGLHSVGQLQPAATSAATHLARVGGAALSHAAAHERLRYEARHDSLTGMPNRRALAEHIADRLAADDPAVGVLFFDVSGFRFVNETYGHPVGDTVLSSMATRTAAALGDGGALFRFSGDQFVAVVADGDVGSLTRLARHLQHVAAGPYRVGQQAVHLTISVGLTAARGAGASATDLVAEAAAACSASRDTAGRDGVRVYDAGLRERARRRLHTEAGLRRALGTDEIETWYQPEYDLSTGQVIGAESLVRWRSPDGRLVMPDEFIPVAESAGLLGLLGLRVLAEACTKATGWPERDPPLLVSVNVAAAQLVDPLFPASVADVLAFTGLEPSRLCLEITESALADPDVASAQLDRLRAIGVLLAIDDFGTGYSSLSRLKSFAVDFLKIDRSFVSGVGIDADDTAIVDAVVALSRTLGLRTIAEGVESTQQAGELRARGVTMGQGYLWSRPVRTDDLLHLLRSPSHGALRPPVAPWVGTSVAG